MAFIFPDIDPVLWQLGSTSIKITWYSLSYVVGIILSLQYIKYLSKKDKIISLQLIDDLLSYIVLGIIIGGRLGYVAFYDLEYNISNPLNIIRTWEGGMSFHGGLLGVIVACFIYCLHKKISFFYLMDLAACATPIGLFLGRIANFINAELYGRVTDFKWAVLFPGQSHPRHASQIYEALTEGFLIFIILHILYRYSKLRQRHGFISGMFLLLYFAFRTLIENYREPDQHLGFIIYQITMGQLLSLPMCAVGLLLIIHGLKNKHTK
jgi:phosphatidylglycerol---prolipoprotein diacylglyceryl transferase